MSASPPPESGPCRSRFSLLFSWLALAVLLAAALAAWLASR